MRYAPFLLLMTSTLALPAAAQNYRGEMRQRVDTSFAFERGGTVHLGLVSGEIRVVGAAGAEIRIVATIERGRLETSFSRSRVSIEARSINNRMGSAHYELTVPVGTRVTASAVSGEIDIRATAAEVTAHTVSGDVMVRDAANRVEVASVSGDLDLSAARGRIQIETVSGEITADELVGDLSFESVSGTFELRRSRLDGIRAESVSGDFRYDGPFAPTGTYRFNTHSGNIELGLPANTGANLELETFSGSIASDFPLTLQPGQSTGGRRDRRLDFTIGNGGARISAESFSGDITIRRLPARGNEEQDE